ncbi:unnamed protein product [Mytilus coruscus]|uniref:Uncharacterized protein n=1 Tax=Mytilus coruscus TaxID=42192 RepID=A0A6J8B838_MYTCO|nr:unnamed protein product [Mytilus coruscus]
MGRKKFGFRKLIKVADVIDAIKKLNITSFRKSWRDSKSECGMVCNAIGRKNSKENRSRVYFIIFTINRRKKRMAQKRKEQTKETSSMKDRDKLTFDSGCDDTGCIEGSHEEQKGISCALPSQSANHFVEDQSETVNEITEQCNTSKFAESIDETSKRKKVVSHVLPTQSSKHFEKDQNETVNKITKPCITSNFSNRKKFNADFESDDEEFKEERNKEKKEISHALPSRSAKHFEEAQTEIENERTEQCNTSKFEKSINKSSKGKKVASNLLPSQSEKRFEEDLNKTVNEITKPCITSNFSDRKSLTLTLNMMKKNLKKKALKKRK